MTITMKVPVFHEKKITRREQSWIERWNNCRNTSCAVQTHLTHDISMYRPLHAYILRRQSPQLVEICCRISIYRLHCVDGTAVVASDRPLQWRACPTAHVFIPSPRNIRSYRRHLGPRSTQWHPLLGTTSSSFGRFRQLQTITHGMLCDRPHDRATSICLLLMTCRL